MVFRFFLNFAVSVLIKLIQAYRYLISPLLNSPCIYTPSCSEYAEAALREHGLLRGCALACGRLLRCHPFEEGGEDPVPKGSGGRNSTFNG